MTTRILSTGHRPATLRSLACAGATVLLAAMPRPASAQRQPVIFQHGFNSHADTWQVLADQLAGVFYLTPYRFDTGAFRTYEEQGAAYLNYALGLPDTTIGVAHSNGGVVTREANRRGRALRGFVTVGTPHRGGGIATSILNGDVHWYVDQFRSRVFSPIIYYDQFYSYPGSERVRGIAYWADQAAAIVAYVPNYLGIVSGDLLAEIAPGSAYRDGAGGLNSPANLAREASAIRSRVAIVSTLSSNQGGAFRLAFTQGQTNTQIGVRNDAIDVYIGLYYYFYFYDDPNDPYAQEKARNADLWYSGADVMTFMPQDWCYLIGARSIYSYDGCLPNDALITGASQLYPNATRQYSIGDVAHTEETASGQTLNVLSTEFRSGSLIITPPGGGGGGGGGAAALTGSISGPATVIAYEQYTWSAGASGGQVPYTYIWSVNGTEIQNSSSANLFYANDGSGFIVSVTIRDAAGAAVRYSRSVAVQSCGGAIAC